MIVKVCGMRDPENISEISRLGVDWIGFIFYDKSPRYIGNRNIRLENTSLKKVGVFVDATYQRLAETAALYQLDYLQLHGDESPELCRALQKHGFSVIKAFSVGTAGDLEKTSGYEGCADFFLFDTKCKNYGGSGVPFDWSVLSFYRGKTPFLLSGGIDPGSAGAIANFSHPLFAGIDLNSRFEVEPGLKDIQKLSAFLSKLHVSHRKL